MVRFLPLILYTITQLIFNTYNSWYRWAVLLLFIPFEFKWRKLLSNHPTLYHPPSTNNLFQKKQQKWGKVLVILALILLLARLIHFGVRFSRPIESMEDVAYLNYNAIKSLLVAGHNPYQAAIDPYPVTRGNKEVFYSGYKYPPLQIFYYAPFVQWTNLGLKGLYVANLLAYLGIAILIFCYLRRFSWTSAALGMIAFLSTDFVFTLSFNKATNDLPATFLLLCSLLATEFNNENGGNNRSENIEGRSSGNNMRVTTSITLSGVLLGLSLAFKQLPAGIIFYCFMLQGRWKILALAAATFAFIAVPFVIWDPLSIYRHIVEFVIVRPARETSWLLFLPTWAQLLVTLGGIMVISIISWRLKKSQNTPPSPNKCYNWGLPVWTLLIFLLTSKMSPTHYFVWLVPFTVLWFFTPKSSREPSRRSSRRSR